MKTKIEKNDIVKFAKILQDGEENLRFVVTDVFYDVENPRAHLQLICDSSFPPCFVYLVEDLEKA